MKNSKIRIIQGKQILQEAHGSQVLGHLLDESGHGQPLYADSAYVGPCNILAK